MMLIKYHTVPSTYRRRANAECVVEALRLGANARHVDNQQQSPLHCIASAGHGVLARHEDDDGDEDDDIDDDGEDANISLQIAQALALAGENGRSQQVGKSRGLKHVDHHRDDEHDNDVHVGEADDIIDNHHDEQSDEDDGDLVKQSSAIVRALVHAGADINARNCGMRTPLHLAALRGNSTLAAALIHAGASTVLVDEVSSHCCVPVHEHACVRCSTCAIAHMLTHAHIHAHAHASMPCHHVLHNRTAERQLSWPQAGIKSSSWHCCLQETGRQLRRNERVSYTNSNLIKIEAQTHVVYIFVTSRSVTYVTYSQAGGNCARYTLTHE